MLALSLLVLRILTNDHDTAFAANNLALFAHGLHGRSYFHSLKPSFQRFVSFPERLLTAPGDPASGQVIRGHLHRDLVAWQDPDEIHSKFSGNVRQNRVSVSNVNLERRIGQSFYHNTFHFNHIGFCQTLSLLVRLDFLAVSREGPAKFTVGDFFFAFDLAGKTVVICRHKQHMLALFAFG